MNKVLIFLILFIVVLTVGAYFYYRKILRFAKGIERGLKMVPILIHLPPVSDDSEVGGRDVRDVVQEKVSQAETLYSLIASTAKKGFKSKFYGQRHIAFELVASGGTIRYYAAVPVVMVPVVEQAILSSYPNAKLEHVERHNIYNPVGKISGTTGGEFELKKEFTYPIATVKELKRDAMQSIINALTTIGKEDGAAVQILIRPAGSNWVKQSQSLVESKRKNKGKKSSSGFSAKELVAAFVKPPEVKESKPEDKQLTSLEQANLDLIEEKTKHVGYETLIRVVASSDNTQKAQTIQHNIVAAFSLFESQGMNGFKFNQAKDIQAFIQAFNFRMFPPPLNKNILNTVELANIFHFPDQQFTSSAQVTRQNSKQVDGPANMPQEGLILGFNVFRGIKKEVRLSPEDRRRHTYIVGQTGTGKTGLMGNLALQDMINGNGFAFIDPHGDAVEELLAKVPRERVEDIIYFNPADMEYPPGLNIFEFDSPDQKDFLIQEAINMLYRLYDPQHSGIIGPRYEHIFRNAALAIMADPAGGTFVDIPKLFRDKEFLAQKLKHVTDNTVLEFWQKEMPQSQRSNEYGEVISWFVSKFGAFLSNQMMRNIIGQTKSSFDLRDVMDNKKILLVNLSKGRTGELNSMLLGMIFIMKFQAAAMSRANIPEEQRSDFSVYVDEFQNFSTESFADILSEARKYRLNLIVGNQYIGQLSDEIRDAVFGNVGTIITLRSNPNDADFLVQNFSPVFDTSDIIKLPNYQAIVRLMMGGMPAQAFSMMTIPPVGKPNPELAVAIKQLSAGKYAQHRSIVERDIFERLKTQEPEIKEAPFGEGGGFGRQSSDSLRPQAGSAGGSSFLDEWLAKRRSQLGATSSINNGLKTQQQDENTENKTQPTPTPQSAPLPQNFSSNTLGPAASTVPTPPESSQLPIQDYPGSNTLSPTIEPAADTVAERSELADNLSVPSATTNQSEAATSDMNLHTAENTPVSLQPGQVSIDEHGNIQQG